ncbi:MAG TPA: GH3 auxin-responsive promoter family protein [Phycisphaerae bacterium]|nr:GH3 auxin-responsive promoter family protein [Phycisphaerae bacterium]
MPNKRPWYDRVICKLAKEHAGLTTRAFFKAVRRATATQDQLLREILDRTAQSRFGREHGYANVRGYDDFRRQVPIRNYDAIRPYIDAVRNGDVGALLHPAEKILMFALTSGTTAEPKYIPVTPRTLDQSRRGWNIWGLKSLADHKGTFLRHIVQVASPMNDHLAPSGVPCGAITGLLASTQKWLVKRYYTSPLAIAGIVDARSKYYTIMRLAIPKDVAWLVTANPSTLLLLARTAHEHREQMIRDVRDGTLWNELAVDPKIRHAIAPRLQPEPELARHLEQIIAGTGTLYPKDYWNLGFRAHWTGGTMGLYEAQFPKYFGDAPARDVGLIASEGRMSIPIEDFTATGIAAVTTQFFEFIPTGEYGSADPIVLRGHELREGEEYFLVLTNHSGLCRYDMGDRVRVTGWFDEAPMIEFLSRDAHTASMAGEKLTEKQVVDAMQRVFKGTAAPSLFVLSPRFEEVPRYRLYIEHDSTSALDHLPDHFDDALCNVSIEYASKRESLRLQRVELAELPAGFLTEREKRLRRQRSRTAEQFKHQYLLPRPGLDQELEAAARLGKPDQMADPVVAP